jgi:hypothetical protein
MLHAPSPSAGSENVEHRIKKSWKLTWSSVLSNCTGSIFNSNHVHEGQYFYQIAIYICASSSKDMTCMHCYLVLCTSSLARTLLPCTQCHDVANISLFIPGLQKSHYTDPFRPSHRCKSVWGDGGRGGGG